MKRVLVLLLICMAVNNGFSQDLTKYNAYNPTANADADIRAAVKKAKAEKKHVLIQIGGNWCIWCARFDELVKTDKAIDSIAKADFVYYHLNYSKENTNEKILARYGYPQRFGFPVFLVLDQNGKLLHTQNSSYLEKDKGHNPETVKGFLTDWSPKALDPAQYKTEK